MKFKVDRTFWLIVAAVAVAITIFFVWPRSASSVFRCPNEYATAAEYVQGLTDWASGELLNSPQMTQAELLNLRGQLFYEHKCAPSRWPDLPAGL